MTSEVEAHDERKNPATNSLIRKLTTEKAVKAYRQTIGQQSEGAEDVLNVKLSSRGIKSIESIELPSLRRLDLSKNSLNRLKGLQGCPQVTYLTVAGNELTGEGLDGVRPLRDLKVFNASGNRLKRVPPSIFAQFRQLQALVLNNNEIAEVPPTWLKKGVLTLNTLVLSHNKVKSLADTGLGRLTALTKLSVSHNVLQDLPDLSACSALEELRAAHNQVTDVPASLTKNLALRTLDLGHNDIQEWRGLERVGKACTSLVQLSLSGNPLCANSAKGEDDEETEAGGGGAYVAKLKVLFPGLKVRDGKRVMLKKSHTYNVQCAIEEEGEVGGKKKEGGGKEETQEKVNGRKRARETTTEKSANSEKVSGTNLGRTDKEECPEKVGYTKKSGRKGIDHVGDRTDDGGQHDNQDRHNNDRDGKDIGQEKKKKKRKKDATSEGGVAIRGERHSVEANGDSTAMLSDHNKAMEKKKKRKRRRETEENGIDTSSLHADAATSSSTKTSDLSSEKGELMVEIEGATAASDAATKTTSSTVKKPVALKARKSKKKDTIDSARREANVGTSHKKPTVEDDPYSSSEELPVPGRLKSKQQKEVKAQKQSGSGKQNPTSAAPQVDLESGVVAVVLNQRRGRSKNGGQYKTEKHGKVSSSDKTGARQHGGDAVAAEETGGFSMEKILQARDSVGLGMVGGGGSAWD